jgi:hypothetical protein
MEGTVTENGSKWSKKHKRRSEVRENELLNEKIKEDRSARKYGSWTTEKEEEDDNEFFGSPCGKEGNTCWRSPEIMGQVDKLQVKWTRVLDI